MTTGLIASGRPRWRTVHASDAVGPVLAGEERLAQAAPVSLNDACRRAGDGDV